MYSKTENKAKKNIAILFFILFSITLYSQKKLCVHDPLENIEVAPTKKGNPKIGGTFGCVRIGSVKKCHHKKFNKEHRGLDLKAKRGTKLFSIHSGIVTKSITGYTDGNKYNNSKDALGNYLKIKSKINGKNVTILYGHLQKNMLSKGDSVKQGQLIGLTGITGNAWNVDHPHVHIKVVENSQTIDPCKYIGTSINKDGSINKTCDE